MTSIQASPSCESRQPGPGKGHDDAQAIFQFARADGDTGQQPSETIVPDAPADDTNEGAGAPSPSEGSRGSGAANPVDLTDLLGDAPITPRERNDLKSGNGQAARCPAEATELDQIALPNDTSIEDPARRYNKETDKEEQLGAAFGGHVQGHGGHKSCWSAKELVEMEFSDTVFVVEGLLPVGQTVCGGRPKSGKSRLALELAIQVATGGDYLGRQCGSGRVVYYALEDGKSRLARRLKGMGAPPALNVQFYLEPPEDLVKAIEMHFDDDAALVIIDTFSRAFMGIDHSDLGDIYQAMAPLQEVATRLERGLFIVDHLRKGRGEAATVEDLLGSIGKSATPDTIWLLDRPQRSRNATLDVISRDLDEDLSLSLEPVEGGRWKCVGDADTAKLTDGLQRILDACLAVHKSGKEITCTTVADRTGNDRGYVSRTLNRLAESGDLLRLAARGNVKPFALADEVKQHNIINKEAAVEHVV